MLFHYSKYAKKTDRLNLVFREGLTGVRVIRAFDKTRFEENRFDLANKDYTNTAIKVNTIVALMMPMMTLIMSGTNVAITWFGGHYIADMTLEVGNLIAFMTYAMQILISFMMLSAILSWCLVHKLQLTVLMKCWMKIGIHDPENPKTVSFAGKTQHWPSIMSIIDIMEQKNLHWKILISKPSRARSSQS